MEKDIAAIVKQCQQGNSEQFTLLFDEYYKKIYDFIYFRTHHKETAEDIVSLVFTKSLENIKTFNPSKGKFSTWLYQIARNSIIDHYRAFKETSNIEDAWDISSNVNIERDTDTKAKLEKVQEFLKTLPRQQRDIVIMRVWDGLSHKEIAEILQISEANSKMSFSRAISKINKEVAIVIFTLVINKLF